VRFTTNDTDENAIRSLELLRDDDEMATRSICVMQDAPWKLIVDGAPQPFEEGKSFKKIRGKRIKNYFTLEDLIRFSTNWGCPFAKDEFWASDQPMYVFGALDDDDNPAGRKKTLKLGSVYPTSVLIPENRGTMIVHNFC